MILLNEGERCESLPTFLFDCAIFVNIGTVLTKPAPRWVRILHHFFCLYEYWQKSYKPHKNQFL